jgi:hypothetical protein
VVLCEKPAQQFFASSRASRVTHAVVLGKRVYFMEVVPEIKVLPAVSVADREVELAMQAAQL